MASPLSPQALARRSAEHPRRVVAIWGVAFVASLAIIATLLGSALTSSTSFVGSTESTRADHQITQQIGIRDADTETVVVDGPGERCARSSSGSRRRSRASAPASSTRRRPRGAVPAIRPCSTAPARAR